MVPERLPVQWLPGLATDKVGRTPHDKQVWGLVIPVGSSAPWNGEEDPGGHAAASQHVDDSNAAGEANEGYVACVLVFDAEGSLIGVVGKRFEPRRSADGSEMARANAVAEVEALLAELGPVESGNIRVQPFSTQVSGVHVGLLAVPPERPTGYVLVPLGLYFGAPFEGDFEQVA